MSDTPTIETLAPKPWMTSAQTAAVLDALEALP